MTNNNASTSGIVLFAKQRGLTSFTSLHQIKRALGTKKVGHTGTLDSFADGLLVVMVGGLTRLASHVTAFDKKYEAIIQFGSQTDTLDPYGEIIETTELPLLEDFNSALKNHVGNIEQLPPLYSAIHIDGKRASDIARSGKSIDIPSRKITVYNAEIIDYKTIENRVAYAKVSFHVSKGTYIRSLARDIAKMANSSAHLIGLRRTAVGNFELKESAGVNILPEFTIDYAINTVQHEKAIDEKPERIDLSQEIIDKLQYMTPSFSIECGFKPIVLKNSQNFDFYNGKPLKDSMFIDFEKDEQEYAVFTLQEKFAGLIKGSGKKEKFKLWYTFVCQK